MNEKDLMDTYVLGRDTNVGYVCFESDSGIVDGVADVFPIFFFLVAALVCVTTMNRMVEEQRTQIGVLKALGYSEHTIMAKYMFYSGSAALTGCVAGFALGTFLFPKVIWYAYGMLYKMDSLVYVFDWKLAVISVTVSLLCSIGTTFVSVCRELTEVAAELMRPKTPKAGKRVFLEYIPFVWKRLKFLQKVSMRNIFRYKKRFFMMVAGISGCSALLVTGFGVRGDSVTGVVTRQYTQIQTYDIGVTYSSSVTPEQKSELESKEQDGVEKSVFVAEKSMDLVGSEKTKSVSLIIADPDSDMTPFVNLHTEKGVPITFPKKGEAVISAKVADELGIKTGDTVTLQDSDMKTISVAVSGLCENFVYNYVYLSADTYEEQMKTEPEYKNAFVCVSEGTDAHLLGPSLMAMSDVAAVNISQDDMERFSSMMGSMDLIVVVIILCAAGLAFIVLCNHEQILALRSVCARSQTIEGCMLGFYENETAAYVFRGNAIPDISRRTCRWLVLGVFLHRFVMSQIVVDMVAFDVHVKPVSFVYSVVLTLVFTWFVDRLMRKKIDAISMTESLKSVD
ncbi:MAG: FtsX-like permease family protein [Roseburia intestinalis]